tara:strand:- start:798 stop:2585 length:1788 start_codon:yes stop_codon:yes gene_type:complete
MAYRRKTPEKAISPYEPYRGPDEEQKYFDWEQDEFDLLLNKYTELKTAYLDGDLRLKNVIVEEPYGHRVQFQVEIKNKVIREWFRLGWLSKSDDQRGTETDEEFKLNQKKRRAWNRCYLDKLSNKPVVPYVFSFSDFWDGAWLTNGGHRITLDERWDNRKDSDKNLKVIDFDYIFPYFDLEDDNRIKTPNLNGKNSLNEIIDEIGLVNWKDKQDNLYHPVNLFEFRHDKKEEALKDHSFVFSYANDNLKQIDLIHAVYSVVNNRVREISDWKSFEDKGIHNSLLELWDSKKFYIKSVPYEFMLRSLLVYTDGLVDNNLNALEDMTKNDNLYKKKADWNKFIDFLDYSIDLYLELNQEDGSCFKIHATRIFEFISLMTKLRGKDRIANIIDEDMFIENMKVIVPALLTESLNKGNQQGSFYDVRSRSSSQAGLQSTTSMVLSRLIDMGSVVLLDPKRNITDNEKATMVNECFITGESLLQDDTEYHHNYVSYAKGGVSNKDNVVPLKKELNRLMEVRKMTTSEFIEMMLESTDYINMFTDAKLEYWKNGGMDDLKSKEGLKRYRYGIAGFTLETVHDTRTYKEIINPPKTIENFTS